MVLAGFFFFVEGLPVVEFLKLRNESLDPNNNIFKMFV
jgi:hypothetical protein